MPQEKPNQEDGRLAKKEIEDKEEDIHTQLGIDMIVANGVKKGRMKKQMHRVYVR